MRAGGFTIQQALSSDAASMIKQAVTLAHRRGHAQVTPLHVADTMLSSTTGLLRTACLKSQSHSHPLQCKALELCFNVALNRLPTSSSSPNHSSRHPSISNALVAAFKRAQAHQRRGTIENQQQPLFSVKIELEQLILSILDDPSVSRVMREAGFSSTQVKTNVEHVVSLDLSSSKDCVRQNSTNNRLHKQVKVTNEDVMCVIESLLNKNRSRSLVVVGECLATIEGVVGKVMEKVDKREVPDALKGVKFISLPLSSFGHLSRGDVEQKLGELRSLVKEFVQRGVWLYLGDLKWINEFRISSWGNETGHYCPIEHSIIELGRLVCDINDTISMKLRIMAISSFQTFMKCRNGNPSLEVILKLHPLTIPAGSLSLSLVPQSDIQSEAKSLYSSSLPKWLSNEKVEATYQDHIQDNLEPNNLHVEGELKQMFPSNPNATSNSSSSTDVMEVEYEQKFREFNGKNLKLLCNALEEKVPWQKDIVPDIAGTILKCRSRMLRRKEKQNNDDPKEETWFLFHGINSRLKEKIAKELAKIVFGSYLNFTTISLNNLSMSPQGDSTDESRNKRPRDEQSCSYLQRFYEALSVNPHRVFLVEDVEQADYCSQMEIKRAILTGKLTCSNGEEVGLCDAIIVLSCESFSSRSRTFSPLVKQKVQEEGSPNVSLDLNVTFDEDHEEQPVFKDDIGLLESVDKCINFNIQDLSL
ncbi:hypothetical protein R6Q57_023912 [Mikania cordata]